MITQKAKKILYKYITKINIKVTKDQKIITIYLLYKFKILLFSKLLLILLNNKKLQMFKFS